MTSDKGKEHRDSIVASLSNTISITLQYFTRRKHTATENKTEYPYRGIELL